MESGNKKDSQPDGNDTLSGTHLVTMGKRLCWCVSMSTLLLFSSLRKVWQVKVLGFFMDFVTLAGAVLDGYIKSLVIVL
jgi:hypothetical protein